MARLARSIARSLILLGACALLFQPPAPAVRARGHTDPVAVAGRAFRMASSRTTKNAGVAAVLAGLKLMNYFPVRHNWTAMWTHWDASAVDADFTRIAALGANAVRLCLQTEAIGYPAPRPEMLAHLDKAISLAHKHGLRVQLTLFDWWHDYADRAGSEQWARAVLAPYTGDPRIAFVELQNEMDPYDPAAMTWARHMLPYVRTQSAGIPVTISVSGTAGPAGLQALVAALAGDAPDFWDVHYYGLPELAESTLRRDLQIVRGGPLFIGEAGFPTDPRTQAVVGLPPVEAAYDAYQDHFYRAVDSAATRLGLPAPAPWILSDFAPGSLSWVPADSYEYFFGLYRSDGTPKPAAARVKAFFDTGIVDRSFDNGFETGYYSGTVSLPVEWRLFHPDEARFARDTTVAHSGQASARISNSGGDSSGVPAFYLTPVDADVIPGHVYSASAWVRGQNATGGTRIAISWFDASGRYLGQVESPWLPNGTTPWMRLTATGMAPAGTAYVQIHLKSADNRGIAWFDNVVFPSQAGGGSDRHGQAGLHVRAARRGQRLRAPVVAGRRDHRGVVGTQAQRRDV